MSSIQRVLCRTFALVGLTLFSSHKAKAQSCAPVLNGAIINVAPECLNDSTAMTINSTAAGAGGWQCVNETGLDGVFNGTLGGQEFEIYGIAAKELDQEVFIVINSHLPITGFSDQRAQDGNTGWGDLFLNLSTTDNFLTASNNKTLYAIKFANGNDSNASQVGVYKEVKAKSVTAANMGFATYNDYVNWVINLQGTPEYGSFGHPQSYYSLEISHNVIDEGTFIGPISILTDSELSALGFACAGFTGRHNLAFKFNKRLIIDECGVIGGDGSSCRDCFGNACGTAKVDQCNVCGGDGTSCLDCKGVPFGNAVVDQCNVCDGDGTSCLDCKNEPFGSAKLDQCNVCGGDGTSCLDCAGAPFGTKTVDRCGVCGGDGMSCLLCTDFNISETQTQMDHGAKQQERIIRLVLKQLKKVARDTATKKYITTVSDQAHELQLQNWILSWTIPSIFTSCENSFCVQKSNKQSVDEYVGRSEQLRKLGVDAIKKLKKALTKAGQFDARQKKAVKKFKKKNDTQHADNVKEASKVPLIVSACT